MALFKCLKIDGEIKGETLAFAAEIMDLNTGEVYCVTVTGKGASPASGFVGSLIASANCIQTAVGGTIPGVQEVRPN